MGSVKPPCHPGGGFFGGEKRMFCISQVMSSTDGFPGTGNSGAFFLDAMFVALPVEDR
jgi:hypothetical protein